MSNSQCDVCGIKLNRPLSPAVIKFSKTDRLWCGECNQDKRAEILIWIYNEDVVLISWLYTKHKKK